jgi:diguanylate cyclase (GGDEF)-like protein
MYTKKGIKLQFALSFLVIMSILSTVMASLYTSVVALKTSLSESYLESNYEYATKLSLNTSVRLYDMKENISAAARLIGHQEFRQWDINAWRSANRNYFNSLFIIDPNGVIELMSPEIVKYNETIHSGTQIETDAIKEALSLKKPFVSEPYLATSGRLVMIITSPIFDDVGHYQGMVGGTIYLKSDNAINHLLNVHVLENGSYVYVVDRSGRIIYHPDPSRVYDDVSTNAVVQKLMQGKSGHAKVVNTRGKEYFAGYAFEEKTGWGIVSQTPVTVTKIPINALLEKVIIRSLPLILIILIVSGFLASTLSKPLTLLARFSEEALHHQKSSDDFQKLSIKSRIYEVRQLYFHIRNHFHLLNNQIQLDGLTGLVNRRTFDIKIREWMEEITPFSLIMIDIDHFKKVNDTYGHLVGDDVLKFLASRISVYSNDKTFCFRYGGEEFGILVKDRNVDYAFQLAERLRTNLAETVSPTGQSITISIGITTSQEQDQDPETIIQRADLALYQSKETGRNRTTLFK